MVDETGVVLLAIGGIAIATGVGLTLRVRRALRRLPDRVAESVVERMAPRLTEATQAAVNAVALQSLGLEFPAFLGGPSVDPFHARHLVDQLVACRPAVVVELGSGSSTILISQVMKRVCDPGYRHIAVDHDAHFLAVTERYARLNGVAERVEFHHCPLAPVPTVGLEWYSGLPALLAGSTVDLLVVDGPPAYLAGQEEARYPALPVLYPRLNTRCTILLDDANRPGERSILERWLRAYPEFTLTLLPEGKGLAVLTR